MVPLRGFQEHQHHARTKDDRGYNSRLKNFIDTVMRLAISKHASPGLTWSHQPKEGKRVVFRHLAKKFPEGNFRAKCHKAHIQARLRRKMSRKKEVSASAPSKKSASALSSSSSTVP